MNYETPPMACPHCGNIPEPIVCRVTKDEMWAIFCPCTDDGKVDMDDPDRGDGTIGRTKSITIKRWNRIVEAIICGRDSI